MQTQGLDKIWLKTYPKGIPAEVDCSRYSSLVHVLHDSCARFGSRPAFHNLGHTISYAETERQTRRMASFFQHHLGLKRGDHIAIQMPNLIQYPIALFGALRAGLVVVNTNPLYTPREMEHQFNDSGVKAVVILANYAYHLQQVLPHTPSIKHIVVTEIGDSLPQPKRTVVNLVVKHIKKIVPAYSLPGSYSWADAMRLGNQKPFHDTEVRPEELAFIQYTGGTTGVSKGAMLTHANLVANLMQMHAWFQVTNPEMGAEEGKEIVITPLPLYHVFALTVNLMLAMSIGALNVLITNPRDMKSFFKELKKWPFSTLSGVNTLFNGMLQRPELKEVNFSHLKAVIAGGMALQRAVGLKWTEATGTRITEGFGLTEASPCTHCNPIYGGENRLGSIGLPLPSTEVKLVNDDGHEVAPGERGELCVRGPQVMKGYYNRPDETEKVIDTEGWLHTGDVAVMETDGYFRIVDRKKDMIVVSGFKVFPNEVEDVVAQHPAVLEVAAVGVPDEKSTEAVKIFVVLRPGHTATEDDIRRYCRENLTNYKVPKHIEFRSELPKSNVGKVLRKPLRDEAVAKLQTQPA